MREQILKHARANVQIADKETGEPLYRGHNLFVDSGRALIASIFFGGVLFDRAKLVCDLGEDTTNPVRTQLDLLNYISPRSLEAAVGYPIALSGAATGVHFQFILANTVAAGFGVGDILISELGLFYRDTSDDFPRRGSVPATMTGSMLARLKSPGIITISNTRTITIDWKIIF